MPAPSRSQSPRNSRNQVRTALADWIDALGSTDRQERESARWALVSLGRPAVAPLLELLHDKRAQVRWEAAKALADLEDPELAPTLVKLLDDEESGIRWIAAEGLIALEHEALPPLLEALEHHGHSSHLREGAHHVIRELHVWKLVSLLTPLMRALEQPAAHAAVPVTASVVLDSLRHEPPPRWRRSRERRKREAAGH
jgi:HEAT repeat protein